MPKNDILPYEWFDTPNIHLCSCKDFQIFCEKNNITIEKFMCLSEKGNQMKTNYFSNFFAYQVIFCVSKNKKS